MGEDESSGMPNPMIVEYLLDYRKSVFRKGIYTKREGVRENIHIPKERIGMNIYQGTEHQSTCSD